MGGCFLHSMTQTVLTDTATRHPDVFVIMNESSRLPVPHSCQKWSFFYQNENPKQQNKITLISNETAYIKLSIQVIKT